jgi:hypothetical protein
VFTFFSRCDSCDIEPFRYFIGRARPGFDSKSWIGEVLISDQTDLGKGSKYWEKYKKKSYLMTYLKKGITLTKY